MPFGHIRVLLIEDSEAYVEVVSAVLAPRADGPFSLLVADSLEAGLARLAAGGIDLILLDLGLPGSEGVETFRLVHARAPDVPIVILTCDEDERKAAEAMKEGAEDYLFKTGADQRVLARTLRHALQRHRHKQEQQRHAAAVAETVHLLSDGFAALAAGDFAVRVADRKPADVTPDLQELLGSFDRTVCELDRLHQMRAQFLSTVVHDLRSPLSTITLAVQSLAQEDADPIKRSRYLEILHRRSQRMVGLIDSLLDYFSAQAGTPILELSLFDLNSTVAQCCEDLSAEAHARGQKLEFRPLETDARVTLDQTKVVRIVENLVLNALKYSATHDTITVAVRCPDQDAVQVDVSDHGPGIDPTRHEEIFQPFVRGSGEATRATQGNGLGLAICKTFVEAHGGSIWVHSTPGTGSRFSFRLPRVASPVAPRRPPAGETTRPSL